MMKAECQPSQKAVIAHEKFGALLTTSRADFSCR